MRSCGMVAMKAAVLGMVGMLFLAGTTVPLFAHTTVNVGQYEVEAGWVTEPPIVGIRNDIALKVVERGEAEGSFTGITGVFKDVDASVLFGGASKQITVNSDPRPGYYYSPIIPTKTGTYMVELQGMIGDVPVDIKIPIEDVEPTAILDFPPSGSSGSGDTAALKNAVSSLQQQVSQIKSGQTTIEGSGGGSYDLGILGLAIAGAAIILAVIAMLKRR